ncbi:hypothetical protein C475_13497 [Halosimplex carlsbadense 2-9-1]|uniref:Uncharacterized protein n=1 Tax=Halosimplex carlsbadense 2-9-1 TaxID=797114 RepID=M0CPE1_9EURY|nr:hypothetical protein [Halosimplex carlsbadense]ELZ24267.1 hypothetical protein C475_13497 [Halosimplex carlsbadense 2-9-1]
MTTDGEPRGRDEWSPTHEVASTGDRADEVAADTRLVAVACEFGDEARLTMSTDDVNDRSPHTQRVLDAELDRLPADASDGANPIWRATLPGDADALVRALTVADPEVDGPLGEARWRVWDVQRIEVRHDGRPIYRSIPHHARFELAAGERPELVERARERLTDLPCAVVPTGPVATWGDGGELTHRTLRFEAGSGASLAHVRRVAVDRDRREIVVDWESVGERVRDEPNRALRTVLRAFAWTADRLGASESPPHRVAFGDGTEFRRAVEGVETVRERVGYDFEVAEV